MWKLGAHPGTPAVGDPINFVLHGRTNKTTGNVNERIGGDQTDFALHARTAETTGINRLRSVSALHREHVPIAEGIKERSKTQPQ